MPVAPRSVYSHHNKQSFLWCKNNLSRIAVVIFADAYRLAASVFGHYSRRGGSCMGGDIKGARLSLVSCVHACDAIPQCVGFVFASTHRKPCWLKRRLCKKNEVSAWRDGVRSREVAEKATRDEYIDEKVASPGVVASVCRLRRRSSRRNQHCVPYYEVLLSACVYGLPGAQIEY